MKFIPLILSVIILASIVAVGIMAVVEKRKDMDKWLDKSGYYTSKIRNFTANKKFDSAQLYVDSAYLALDSARANRPIKF